MSYIRTISEEQADGLVQDQYQDARKNFGYIPNYVKAFSLHPEVYSAWEKLLCAIQSKMSLRRYELVTFAAAIALECRYWMLAHGTVLRKNFFSLNELEAIVKDFRNSGLPVEEIAMMSFAQKVINETHKVNKGDIDELRKHGLSDDEILDVILVSTARSFISKTVDALGAIPDKAYQELEPELLQLLTLELPLP